MKRVSLKRILVSLLVLTEACGRRAYATHVGRRDNRLRRLALVPLLVFAPLVVLPACMEESSTGLRAPLPTGSLEITTVTTGLNLDSDGYLCSLDFGSRDPMGVNDTGILTGLSLGDHSVLLMDIADNCQVSGSNPRWVRVVAEQTAQITFSITCG